MKRKCLIDQKSDLFAHDIIYDQKTRNSKKTNKTKQQERGKWDVKKKSTEYVTNKRGNVRFKIVLFEVE